MAVADAIERHGALLDELTTGMDDPAHVFAQSFRLTGRLHRRSPELSRVLLSNGLALAGADSGLAPPRAAGHRQRRPGRPLHRSRP